MKQLLVRIQRRNINLVQGYNAEQENRTRELEVDTVIGKDYKGVLVSVVDRKSKFVLIKNVLSKEASVVTEALIKI